MSSTTLCHGIKSISVKVTQHASFFDTRFKLIDSEGHEYEFSALSSKQINIEHEPMQVVKRQEVTA